jgi:protein disulfide-isomerase A1
MASLLVIAALVAVVSGAAVKVLDDDNFSETIASGNVIVEFFAPWCGHCKSLAPHFEKAAATLADEGIVLASVDATVYGELAGKYDVKGYPTLKVFKNGAVSEYKGGRTEDTIVSYARKIFGPPAVEISTDAELTNAQKNKVATVGFFADKSGAEYTAFIAQANADQDFPYYVSFSADLAGANGVSQPGIKLFKQFDEGSATFDGEFTVDGISSFVASNSVPTVIPFSMDSVQDIFSSKLGKVAFLFRSAADAADLDTQFKAVATAFRGTAVFVTADFAEPRLNQYLGVDEKNGASFLLAEVPQGAAVRRFPLAGAITEESITSLLNSYKSGSLKPTLKSDPIPATNNENVKVVVGNNFASIVLDPSKDVLLEVYAPWCGHCKKLEPVWNDLGQQFANDDTLVIAKMDGTTNEVDGLNAQGFPTILFYPAGANKTPGGQAYNGGRELKDFKDFIKTNHHAGHSHGAGGHSHDEL